MELLAPLILWLSVGQVPAVTVCQPLERDLAHVDFPARFEPRERVFVRAPYAGVVAKVAVKPGEVVRKGDVLVELEGQALEDSVRRAEREVELRQAQQQKLQERLNQARKLITTSVPKEVAAKYQSQLGVLLDPLHKANVLATAYVKGHVGPLVGQVRNVHEHLDKTLLLLRNRNLETPNYLLEQNLRALRPLISLDVPKDADAVAAAWRHLEPMLDQVEVLVAARSPQGLDALTAEQTVGREFTLNAQASLDQARRALADRMVHAPVAGVVVGLTVKHGDRTDGAFCAIDPPGRVTVSFDGDPSVLLLLQKHLRDHKPARLADLPVHLGVGQEQGFPHTGVLDVVDTAVDRSTTKVHFLAVFPDPSGNLAATMAAAKQPPARVRLKLGETRTLLLVPAKAIGTEADGTRYVLLVNVHNIVEKRPVKVAAGSSRLQGIEAGLKASDWVILGSERPPDAGGASPLLPQDFVPDVNVVRIRPGSVVEPFRVVLPGE